MRALPTLLLLLLPLSLPAIAEPTREGPAPERVYRQIREDPAIQTREEALEFLAEATASDLWRSSKLSADARIKEILTSAGFDSLDQGLQSHLHASMLEVRSSFWIEDLEKLATAGAVLRGVWEGGSVVAEAESPEDGNRLQGRLLALVEVVELAVALQTCAQAAPHLATDAYLDCLLRGGPGD